MFGLDRTERKDGQMTFSDSKVGSLNLRDPASIVLLIGYLRGDIIAYGGESEEEKNYTLACLEKSPQVEQMIRKNQQLSFAQLNELLLLLDKSRIGKGFYYYFFVPSDKWFRIPIDRDNEELKYAEALRTRVNREESLAAHSIKKSELREGVIKFRVAAMLKYGNFRFAHKHLRNQSLRQICESIHPYSLDKSIVIDKFERRLDKALDFQPIPGNDTWLTGYISAGNLNEDNCLLRAAMSFLRPEHYKQSMSSGGISSENRKLVKAKIKMLSQESVEPWRMYIDEYSTDIDRNKRKEKEVKKKACDNTDIYLTWDYMDIYVATSMRETWEFEEIRKFIDAVLEGDCLERLKLRYFDPTQSFTDDRLNKGFIEGLMLKRARLTIYLVQESDSLGKDSELAATLAQGKPVVAFVPYIPSADIPSKAKELSKRPLVYFFRRFLACKAENHQLPEKSVPLLRQHLGADATAWRKVENDFLNTLRDFYDQPRFITILRDDVSFKANLGERFDKMCLYMTIMEKVSYDKRAEVLQSYHPLAMQVNLSEGVANGVLVARTYENATNLIYGLLTNSLDFRIEGGLLETAEHARCEADRYMARLVETISDCPFRAVTGHNKITNSFWNFYLQEGA